MTLQARFLTEVVKNHPRGKVTKDERVALTEVKRHLDALLGDELDDEDKSKRSKHCDSATSTISAIDRIPEAVVKQMFEFIPYPHLPAVMSTSKTFLDYTKPFKSSYRHWNLCTSEVGGCS